MNVKEVLVQGDSELVINQMNGIYNVNNNTLSIYHNIATSLALDFENIKFEHIKRNLNKVADKLANDGLNNKEEIITSI